ncbi:MAG: hypothetical protein A3A96_03530 [Candidatus Zambryskibacteria bacterium RIFCSPLOWO2_01_FULL_39_39]|uniref:Uncharacterized protein n=1 Tax=Candidatus Zambryskibacteria bacterium RIFCSPLOWO2_01_FULL_39_39 TaxID=1802758 RepID=A0A1G2TXN2_9BACT|nr:MAG: hypothetical protein A2644_00790 [Candidatus Zambryskibacteria bacterium RIFCSPHIGHO2_01_FULL_39_63]OHA95143.1 MAG: hypothetical protein A3B88_02820 [Candidatus Zambryskibacteria bacterium RIFCSPHIGHO2_02_FULL_39_19]OHA98645.1 MAG: hypothetical protein A3F20_00110 [Candidatus Zambryskibacteria bacterium RIFCSPHIGHO2_12_FULL_39_21]OHB02051.1 MAG: hypothetical protein A3A96_03530 [Candidatus Zambryskibacteria bacterium RIFCSPLOWO2_01_FULL_39_39]
MNPEEKEDTSKDFGKVIDALHNKQKLSSLRTYQGDMAEFIKDKNESVISVAVKEKVRDERREEQIEKVEEKIDLYHPIQTPTSNKKGFQINLTMIFLSLLLIVGGSVGFFYAFEFIKNGSPPKTATKEEIIPYNNLITLANVTNVNLGEEFGKLSSSAGINIVKISDANGESFQKIQDFLNFLQISPPSELVRTLRDEYALGVISQNEVNSSFMVITVDDFGRAFAGMLDWEKSLEKDLFFLSRELPKEPEVQTDLEEPIQPTQPSETIFTWKDVIIKNKDTRALVDEGGRSIIAYTFLDKNTILITDNTLVIGDITSAYNTRSVAR